MTQMKIVIFMSKGGPTQFPQLRGDAFVAQGKESSYLCNIFVFLLRPEPLF